VKTTASGLIALLVAFTFKRSNQRGCSVPFNEHGLEVTAA
jgi:hypothetical protein